MPNTSSNSLLSMASLLFGCVIFGLGSVIVAHVAVGSFAMAFWRLLVSSFIFIALAVIFQHRLPKNRSAILFGLLSGAALGFDLALWHESVHAVGPGISTLLNSLQIFFLAFIGYVFFKEKQSPVQLLSLVVAVVGVGLIASPEFRHNLNAGWGFVAGIISGAFLAISMSFIRQAHKSAPVPIFSLMSLVGVGGAAALLPVMLWFDQGKILPTTLTDVGWILIYGAVMQCVAWGLIAHAIPRLSLALTGLLLLSEPVAALVIDYVWLEKPISIMQWSGAALTLFAIYLGSVGQKPKTK